MREPNYNDNVFINCPFDKNYKSIFNAIVFTVYDCGFNPRCTLEEEDSSENRLMKIMNIISECKYGIHDISRTEITRELKLPRFNMPLELGIFLGCKKFGIEENKNKRCLILDRDKYRYQKFISDISGQDIKSHKNNPEKAVTCVRDWLGNTSKRKTIPSGSVIWGRYQQFTQELPDICDKLHWVVDELTFQDYSLTITEWLEENT